MNFVMIYFYPFKNVICFVSFNLKTLFNGILKKNAKICNFFLNC